MHAHRAEKTGGACRRVKQTQRNPTAVENLSRLRPDVPIIFTVWRGSLRLFSTALSRVLSDNRSRGSACHSIVPYLHGLTSGFMHLTYKAPIRELTTVGKRAFRVKLPWFVVKETRRRGSLNVSFSFSFSGRDALFVRDEYRRGNGVNRKRIAFDIRPAIGNLHRRWALMVKVTISEKLGELANVTVN